MKVTDIQCVPVSVPLLRPFKAAYGTRDTADFVVVRLFADNGLVGLGEAATIPIYDEGSQAGTVYCIERYFKPLLLGEDPRRIGAIHSQMNACMKGERYAKSAIDYALYDLTSQYYKIPVYQLLGGFNRHVQVTAVLSASDTEELVSQAVEKKEQGYRVFKLKLGGNHATDLERVRLLRETLGLLVQLRLDANEAWGAKEALQKIRQFEPYQPTHIEQPVPRWDLDGLKLLKENSPVPIVIDESVVTLYDANRVISYVKGDFLNIKTARSGGLFPSLKIAAVAEAAGVASIVGSMLELGIGTVANGHFGAALTGGLMATEIVGPLFVKKDILKQELVYENGHLILPEGPGWGVQLDEDAVREFTTK